ncbi:MAG TPA: DUF4129 domain-containing protein [Gemmatimonadaceae bacterium]|nr:DUF4129 domain-containing protein [Gemmatimonadaceae bacterium]
MHLLQPGGEIPAAMVRDTVAAIARQAAYRRSVRSSLVQRAWRWLDAMLERLFDALPPIPHARTIAIVGVILVALLVLLRIGYAARLRDEAVGRVRLRRDGGAAAGDPAAEAMRLAAAGHFTEAAHALYRALLAQVARREQLRVHPSKTSGDYARELRARRSPLHEPFRRFGRRYERLLFGEASVTADGYAALVAMAEPLLRERAS